MATLVPTDTGPELREVLHDAVTAFRWRYDTESPRLRTLYEKSKNLHWNATSDLDWSIDVDPEVGVMPEQFCPIYGSRVWERLTDAERRTVGYEANRYTLSSFLHGEQGALIATAQIAASAPNFDAKLYAAQQVTDEARHAEVFSRYLDEKLGGTVPVNAPLWALLEDTVRDSRPDMTQLGMQVMIEGLALAWFGLIQQTTTEPLLKRLLRLVMNDESRHVAFGVLYLKEQYAEISDHERLEREEFVYEAAVHMRDRFLGSEIWERCGLPVAECDEFALTSPTMIEYRKLLFSRIVPNLKRIGLLTPTLRARLEPLGILQWEDFQHADEAEAIAA